MAAAPPPARRTAVRHSRYRAPRGSIPDAVRARTLSRTRSLLSDPVAELELGLAGLEIQSPRTDAAAQPKSATLRPGDYTRLFSRQFGGLQHEMTRPKTPRHASPAIIVALSSLHEIH